MYNTDNKNLSFSAQVEMLSRAIAFDCEHMSQYDKIKNAAVKKNAEMFKSQSPIFYLLGDDKC